MKTRKLSAQIFFITICLFVALAAAAQTKPTLPAGVVQVTSVEGVTEYRLANGLRVLLVPDSSTPTATVSIVYLVGSRFESYGETGMAHLLEHLMFKGTPAHPNIPDELSKHGAQPNGTTSDDRTIYFEKFAATEENLDWALSLEADRMVNSFIAKKDLDSEMTVVRNEFESGENSPDAVLYERVLETAYLWHNYGHPTIGARSDIERVPIERLQAFYRKYYQPDNAVLIVGGKFAEGKTLGLIQQKFGNIPRPTRVLQQPYTEEPAQDGEREVTLRRVGDVQVVMAAYHIPAAGHPDTVAFDVLTDILDDPAAGRLRKRLVDSKLATGARASINSMHDPGTIFFTATVPKGGDVQAAREELIKISQELAKQPLTQEELNRARAEDLDQLEKMLANGNYVAMMLSDAVAHGDWRLLFWNRDQIKKVTVEDLQRVAEKYLVPSNLTVGMFIPVEKPERAAIPETPDYEQTFKDYKGETAVAAGEQFDPTPANIEGRTTRSAAGPIKLALLSKKTRANLVTVVLKIHFGDEKSLSTRNEAADFAANLLMHGTVKHDMQQLRDALTAARTQMSVRGGPTGVTISLKTDREHLAAALRLAAEVLREPSFPEKEFDEEKRNAMVALEGRRTDPGAVADLALERSLSPYPKGHVNYVPTLDESIAQVKATTLEDVKKFYRDFYGIGTAEMAIVGDFDPKDATNLVTELFASWKSPAKYARVPDLFKAVPPKTDSFNTPDKENAVFMAGTNLEIRDDDGAYPALAIGNYMLGGGFLNSRLAVRIRQKEGLSYTVFSQFQASSLDKAGHFYAMAICAPQNYAKVSKAFHEEMVRALADGFTADELKDAISGYLQSREVSRSNDDSLAGSLADHLFKGRDFHWDEQYENKVRTLTTDQIKEGMRQFIDPGKLVIVGAGDFSKAGK